MSDPIQEIVDAGIILHALPDGRAAVIVAHGPRS